MKVDALVFIDGKYKKGTITNWKEFREETVNVKSLAPYRKDGYITLGNYFVKVEKVPQVKAKLKRDEIFNFFNSSQIYVKADIKEEPKVKKPRKSRNPKVKPEVNPEINLEVVSVEDYIPVKISNSKYREYFQLTEQEKILNDNGYADKVSGLIISKRK